MQASLAGSSSRSAANGPGVRRCACALRGPARPSQRCIARREPCCRLGAAVAAAASAEPTISVTFQDSEGAKAEVDCPSGEQLRAVMMENKIDLYTTWGKIWSCGGVGQCGTCIVKVEEGADLLSERTITEEKKLKGKPESWRLACQTIVGDGDNTGKVVISTKPQQ